MTGSSFTILRVRGIPIGAHWTWLLVFALVVWSLGTALFPADGDDYETLLHRADAAMYAEKKRRAEPPVSY